ncbi:MAG: AAA family ATPase [Candidatus Hydrogenedentes bacterium]|nr:AAA family ATPase [Candidatus Hydrogenedentota bacterium]
MYEAFYGLNEKPFNLTPDPRFLFLSEKHKEAFAHLLYGIKNRTGFIMVSGEVGTGKTTICRSLLSQLDPDIEVAFIFNPFLSPEELLRKINEDFGILSQGRTLKELIDELNEYLLDRNALGKNCVLVIDEAQDLSPTVLEQIRLLSNLETETQKLLQIVLIGQPELAENLQLPQLRQLNQRITARYHLRPLNEKETLQYIAYRLSAAGGRGQVRFTRAAIRCVFKASGGTPRVINAICDRALLIGYTRELRDISARLVREAAREIRGATLKKGIQWGALALRYGLPCASVILTAAVLMALVKLIGPFDQITPRAGSLALAQPPGAPGVATDPAPDPTPALPPPTPAPEPKPAPPPVAPEPGQQPLAQRIKTLDAKSSRDAALAGILAAWNMAVVAGYPEDDSPATLAAFGRSNGLACEILTPALDQLMAIGLPALARLKTGDESRWVALTRIENGLCRITAGGTDLIDVPRDEFRECYAHEAIVFWRDPRPTAPVLRRQANGPEVADLKRALRAMSRLRGPATAVYDEETTRAVARLQAETGLYVDGIAGKQVRMVLTSWVGGGSTPSLVKREKIQPLEAAPQPPQPILAAREENKPQKTPEPAPRPDVVAKQEPKPDLPTPPMIGLPDEPELLPGFNSLPDLPLRPIPGETPPLTEPTSPPAQDKPGEVTAAPLPQTPSGVVPPMPRLPGAPAPVAVQTAPLASEAVDNELHS